MTEIKLPEHDGKVSQGMNGAAQMFRLGDRQPGTLVYTQATLKQILRDVLEQAAQAYEAEALTWVIWPEAGAAKRKGANAIRALKEQVK